MQPDWAVPAFDIVENAALISACEANRRWLSSSAFVVKNKRPNIPFSMASATNSIDRRTLASPHRVPNIAGFYCLGSTDRRNACLR